MSYRTAVCVIVFAVAVAGCRRAQTPTSGTQPGDTVAPGVISPAVAVELQKLAGTWVVTAARIDDDDLPNQVGIEYTFAAGKLTLREGDRVLDTSKVVLNPTTKPKSVDLISDNLREGESPALFIYELDGDTLRLCRGDNTRPTSFTAKEQVVFTLKRKK